MSPSNSLFALLGSSPNGRFLKGTSMSSIYVRPFEAQADSQTLTVAATTTTTAITATASGTRSVRLVNSGSNIIFFKLGTSGVVSAVATSTPMLPNTVEVFLLRNDVTHISYIGAAAGNSLYLTVGESA